MLNTSRALSTAGVKSKSTLLGEPTNLSLDEY